MAEINNGEYCKKCEHCKLARRKQKEAMREEQQAALKAHTCEFEHSYTIRERTKKTMYFKCKNGDDIHGLQGFWKEEIIKYEG